jgi:hypothetical protein
MSSLLDADLFDGADFLAPWFPNGLHIATLLLSIIAMAARRAGRMAEIRRPC